MQAGSLWGIERELVPSLYKTQWQVDVCRYGLTTFIFSQPYPRQRSRKEERAPELIRVFDKPCWEDSGSVRVKSSFWGGKEVQRNLKWCQKESGLTRPLESWVMNLKTSKFSLSAFALCYQFIPSGCPIVVYRVLSRDTANLEKPYLKLES